MSCTINIVMSNHCQGHRRCHDRQQRWVGGSTAAVETLNILHTKQLKDKRKTGERQAWDNWETTEVTERYIGVASWYQTMRHFENFRNFLSRSFFGERSSSPEFSFTPNFFNRKTTITKTASAPTTTINTKHTCSKPGERRLDSSLLCLLKWNPFLAVQEVLTRCKSLAILFLWVQGRNFRGGRCRSGFPGWKKPTYSALKTCARDVSHAKYEPLLPGTELWLPVTGKTTITNDLFQFFASEAKQTILSRQKSDVTLSSFFVQVHCKDLVNSNVFIQAFGKDVIAVSVSDKVCFSPASCAYCNGRHLRQIIVASGKQ